MGGKDITNEDLVALGVVIEKKDEDGDRSIRIEEERLGEYIELVKSKLTAGFWNEIIGESEIIFIFKLKNGSIKEYRLSPENEQKIDDLCAEFNDEEKNENANVYKYISGNKFYHDFMLEHYSDMINRK